METYKQFKKRLLKNPEIRRHYEELQPEFDLACALIEKRIQKKMTQAQLAKKVGTKQSAISRLESGSSNPSFNFLRKVAKALGAKLKVSFS